MDRKICQSCGMPLEDVGFYGTDEDETLNDDYCIYCYSFGSFNDELTMEEMIEANLEFSGISPDDEEAQEKLDKYRSKMHEIYPKLKRWSSNV